MRFLASSLRQKFESPVFASQNIIQNAELKEERPYGDYKNNQILSIKNFMSELVIFNLTFLCQNILSYVLTYTLQRFDVEFSKKDCVTSKMVILQCMQILCSVVRHTATLLNEKRNDKMKTTIKFP